MGLRSFELVLPDDAHGQQLLARIADAGVPVELAPGGAIVGDPSGNAVLLRSR